jgi:hypothetical protein
MSSAAAATWKPPIRRTAGRSRSTWIPTISATFSAAKRADAIKFDLGDVDGAESAVLPNDDVLAAIAAAMKKTIFPRRNARYARLYPVA